MYRQSIFFSGILILLFVFTAIPFICAQNPQEIINLELDKPQTREISGGQKHIYQINLAASQYLSVTVEQKGVDVAIRLRESGGKLLADYDAEMRPNGIEKVEFTNDGEGIYLLEIEPRYRLLPAGQYEIRLAVLQTASEKEKTLQKARNLHTESLRLFNAGNYTEAKKLIEQAIEIRQTELGLENDLTANALTLLARISDALGDYDEAIRLNQNILKIREKILGAEHPDLAYTYNYLALNFSRREDFQTAISFHQKALAIREKVFGANHPIVAVSLINLGVIFDALGDKSKAGELYLRALAIQEKSVGTENLNTAVVINNIGKIYNDLEKFAKAEPFSLRAVAILEKLLPPEHPRILDSLSNLAVCYIGLQKLREAESIYQRILDGREKTVGSEHPLTAHVLYNFANFYALTGNFQKSETFYRRALEIRENKLGAEHSGVGEVLSALALLMAQKGDVAQALQLQQRANAVNERNINLNLAIGSERQKIAYLESLSEQINQNLSIQTRFAPENQLAVELALTTILRQKGRVMDAVSKNLTALRQRSKPENQALIDKLNNVTGELAGLIIEGREDISLNEYQAKVKFLTDEREKLEDEISRRVAGFYEKSNPINLSEIKKLIPSDAVLIEFAVYTPVSLKADKTDNEPRYVAYILHNQGDIKWKDIGKVKEIDKQIDLFRQSLRDAKRQDIQTVARELDEKIMSPLRAFLGDASHILVSADGNLNLIPFEALVDEKNRYLVEIQAFTYLTSGRDLLRLQVSRESKNKSLVIANPIFGETENQNNSDSRRRSITATRSLNETYFAPLSGTAQEARAIQTIFPEFSVLTQSQATESALKQTTAPNILHIATHGFFLEDKENSIENPLLRSGLAFAGANRRNDGKDDGILTALEASGLNLWGTKLVVLSACDTGLGEVRNGEGVYGLRRAFILAGTESLVMSLWSVSDYVTRELMTNYYKNLKSGMGRGAALRGVQLEMLKKPNRQHPFYWASFIQSGDWTNLSIKN